MNPRQILLLADNPKSSSLAIGAYSTESSDIEVLWFRSERKLSDYILGRGCYTGRGPETNIYCITIDPSFQFNDENWVESALSAIDTHLQPTVFFLPSQKQNLRSTLTTGKALSFRSALLRNGLDAMTRPLVKYLIRNRKSNLLLQQL